MTFSRNYEELLKNQFQNSHTSRLVELIEETQAEEVDLDKKIVEPTKSQA